MKWLRPTGIIGFAVVAAAIGLFWWFAAGWLVKTAVEEGGSRVVGARVDLDSADVTFAPFGVRLHGLQVTNPEQPMENLVEIKSISANLELLKALMGQVIIDDLGATGVRFNTPRTTSGEIKKAVKPETEEKAEAEPALDLGAVKDKLPTVDEIMAREPLTTVTRAQELKSSVQQQRTDVDQAVAGLPTEERLTEYEARIKQLTSEKITGVDDLQKRKQELDKLKDDIRNDKKAIEAARDRIRDAKSVLTAQYDGLKNAPREDLTRILERYGLDSSGAANITRLLFGDTAKKWLETAQSWYLRIKDFMPASSDDGAAEPPPPPRGSGRFVHFPTANPTPDFLVRRARLGTELPLGNIDLQLADATHQPHILGRPMTLKASGEKLPAADKLTLNGVFDHINPAASKDNVEWQVSGWKIADIALSKGGTLPMQLQSASVNVNGNLALAGEALNGAVDAKFLNAAWKSDAKDGWAAQVAKTLAAINTFSLTGNVQGALNSPDISIKSDLDQQIKGAAKAQLKSQQAELEQKLKVRLEQEIEKSAGPYKDQVAMLTQSEGSLDERIKKIEEMLKAEMQSAVDSKKEEAEQKLKDKLKGLKF